MTHSVVDQSISLIILIKGLRKPRKIENKVKLLEIENISGDILSFTFVQVALN